MYIKQQVDEWDESPLTNWFNKLIDMPQPEPKGPAFKMKSVSLPEFEYPEFVNQGKVISQEEAEMPY